MLYLCDKRNDKGKYGEDSVRGIVTGKEIPTFGRLTNPEIAPDQFEVNASDVEMIEYQGVVHIWWCGGNPRGLDDLQHAIYRGTRQHLLEAFFD